MTILGPMQLRDSGLKGVERFDCRPWKKVRGKDAEGKKL